MASKPSKPERENQSEEAYIPVAYHYADGSEAGRTLIEPRLREPKLMEILVCSVQTIDSEWKQRGSKASEEIIKQYKWQIHCK